MYLGMLLILAGPLVLLGSLGPIVVAWLITTRSVHVEERILEARFGDAYPPAHLHRAAVPDVGDLPDQHLGHTEQPGRPQEHQKTDQQAEQATVRDLLTTNA
jgi:hypothetical protein